ncbi:MAG: hypothetical protein HOV94_41185 [Saccharothrix sp.]|nr:hypothetical protein [Saccharothrix sp.]
MREDWQRLASFVVHDRVQLGHRRREDFARASHISMRTLGDLETGRRVSKTTLGLAEHALRWTPGSALRVLAGGDPTRIGDTAPEPTAPDDSEHSGEDELLAASMADLIRMRQVYAFVMGTPAADDFLRKAVQLQTEARSRRAHGA